MRSCQRGGCTTQSCLRFVMVGLGSTNGVSSPETLTKGALERTGCQGPGRDGLLFASLGSCGTTVRGTLHFTEAVEFTLKILQPLKKEVSLCLSGASRGHKASLCNT